ncbi:MAG: sodium:proton exchanger [Flavobacteriales bacterium]|nr:sodium:proton exchanger [Flavobacteriales bacterium]
MDLEFLSPAIFAASKTPYYVVIAASAIIILSYFFNVISQKTNIPSVILLIATGIGMHYGLDYFGFGAINDEIINNGVILPILGQVGLILIVLEAALDLELSKEKWPVIWKSFVVALLALLGSTAIVAAVLEFFIFYNDWDLAIVCAIPISIMSSAIIIPSVTNLMENRKEFMIYESTFSDILGIMLFYPFLDSIVNPEFQGAGAEFGKIFLTLIVSVLISYGLIWLFQRIKSQVKLFLLIALLCLLYVVGKIYGLSTLLLILIFGLMLNNSELFFQGKLSKYINHDKLNKFLHDFHILSLESAFVLRTFFFVIFGITISLSSLLSLEVALISSCVVIGLYLIRWIFLKLFVKKETSALLFIAPRGLITVLLFFAVVSDKTLGLGSLLNADDPVNGAAPLEIMNGVILYAIIITSVLMTFTLIKRSGDPKEDDLKEMGDGDLKEQEQIEEGSEENIEDTVDPESNSEELAEPETLQESAESELKEELKDAIEEDLDQASKDIDPEEFDDPEGGKE